MFWQKWFKRPSQVGTKKAAVVGLGCGFVTMMSATTIEAVMRTLGRNLSGKRALSPKLLLNNKFPSISIVFIKIDSGNIVVNIEKDIVKMRTQLLDFYYLTVAVEYSHFSSCALS